MTHYILSEKTLSLSDSRFNEFLQNKRPSTQSRYIRERNRYNRNKPIKTYVVLKAPKPKGDTWVDESYQNEGKKYKRQIFRIYAYKVTKLTKQNWNYYKPKLTKLLLKLYIDYNIGSYMLAWFNYKMFKYMGKNKRPKAISDTYHGNYFSTSITTVGDKEAKYLVRQTIYELGNYVFNESIAFVMLYKLGWKFYNRDKIPSKVLINE